jgi:hypothetical protein
MEKIKAIWRAMQSFAHSHEKIFHHAHNTTHLAYFSMVAAHGPYHWAAAVLLILGILSWILHVEAE